MLNIRQNPYYSLFNDTASYFITWSVNLNGKRMIAENNSNFSTYNDVPYFMFTSVQNYNSGYYLGPLTSYGSSRVEYDDGEGWMDAAYTNGQSKTKINSYNQCVCWRTKCKHRNWGC